MDKKNKQKKQKKHLSRASSQPFSLLKWWGDAKSASRHSWWGQYIWCLSSGSFPTAPAVESVLLTRMQLRLFPATSVAGAGSRAQVCPLLYVMKVLMWLSTSLLARYMPFIPSTWDTKPFLIYIYIYCIICSIYEKYASCKYSFCHFSLLNMKLHNNVNIFLFRDEWIWK